MTIDHTDDEYTEPTVSMARIAQIVREAGHSCYVAQSGGGCATIYAGEQSENENDNGRPFYPVVAGVGSFWETGQPAYNAEFGIGPDDEQWTPEAHYSATDTDTAETLAAEIIRQLTA